MTGDASDNGNAKRYSVRTSDRENLEASDEFFLPVLCRRSIRGGCGSSWTACSTTAVPSNKWMDREKIYEKDGGYEPGAYLTADSPYRDFFLFEDQDGWPDNDSYEGWWGHNTLPKLNYEGSKSCTSMCSTSRNGGFPRRTRSMAGVSMWRRISVIHRR